MPTYLRVEAQNLSNTLQDTDQLSVIRGSSLLLRDAIRSLADALSAFAPRKVRVGGEAAIFELGEGDVSEALRHARSHLASTAPQFTFAVCAVRAQDDSAGLDASLAAVRWRQPRSARIVPDPAGSNEVDQICELTRVRAACADASHSRIQHWSQSAWSRYQFGVGQKRSDFYLAEADPAVAHGLQFVDDLEALTGQSPYPALEGKLAVLSIDGNKFSALARRLGDNFDEDLTGLRRAMLTQVLTYLLHSDAPHNERHLGQRLRLEVLMWSGDEFKLLLPAWLGVPVLQLLFDVVSNWRLTASNNDAQLSVSAGLLLCPHTLPIHQAIRIADQLQHRAKRAAKTGPTSFNCWDYLVLESLDYPAALDLDEFWARRFVIPDPEAGAIKRFGPSPLRATQDYSTTLAILADALDAADSRRKVYASSQLLADPHAAHRIETTEWQKQPEARRILTAIHQLLPVGTTDDGVWPPDPSWLHLRELWDYVLPKTSRVAQEAEQSS